MKIDIDNIAILGNPIYPKMLLVDNMFTTYQEAQSYLHTKELGFFFKLKIGQKNICKKILEEK
jgi:hypothetical protein